MHTARIIVNSLAFFTGFCGLVWSGIGSVILLAFATGRWPTPRSAAKFESGVLIAVTLVLLVYAILGVTLLRQVWKHWRRPARGTARLIVGFTSFFLGFYLLRYGLTHELFPDAGGLLKPAREIALLFGAAVASYLVYRLALRRLADAAFPPAAPESGVH